MDGLWVLLVLLFGVVCRCKDCDGAAICRTSALDMAFLPPFAEGQGAGWGLRLLQIVLKVLRNTLVEVYALVSAHVVRLTGIYEEVRLRACTDTCFQEGIGVLGNYHGVVETDDDLQLAFQILGLAEQRSLCVASGLLCGVSI